MANLNTTRINGNLIVSGISEGNNHSMADYVVERGGTNSLWWTRWASGWIECGGIMSPVAAAMTTQTFPVTFSTLPAVTTTFLYGSDGTGYYQYLCPRNISTTGFTINTYVSSCQGTAWRAEGF